MESEAPAFSSGRPFSSGDRNLSQAAAAPRLCDYHKRAGIAVPAVYFVEENAFCSACFDGKPILSRQERETRKAISLARPRRTAPKIDQALRPAERIHTLNPVATKL